MTDTPIPVDRDPETVELYVEESLEGLQQIEQLLLSAESGANLAEVMGTLFRTMHTIKGTAGYLAFEQAQKLSHAAEDLLSKLRDKRLAAVPAHFALLMTVGDKLRRLVENVKQTGEEGSVEIGDDIVALRAALDPQNQAMTAEVLAAHVLGQVVPLSEPAAAAAAPSAPMTQAPPVQPVQAIAAPATHEATPETSSKAEAADSTVRVNVAVLDRLMNLIGELVLARNQMMQLVQTSLDSNMSSQSVFQRFNIVTSELQEQVMKTRMQPVARVFEKIPRMVRDVARAVNKQVTTQIEGNATEIDKTLVEAIRDPVMHIVRNAIDHGIEDAAQRAATKKPLVGTVFVRAAHKGGAVTIEIEDDGRGMDPKIIRSHAVRKGVISQEEADKLSERQSLELIFKPGFSTAAQVTDISGRGVGMDVVRTHVERAGGQAEIESTVGKGSVIRLKMPLTLAILPALLVRAGHQRFAISQVNLLELIYLTEEQQKIAIDSVRGAVIHRLRGEILPVVNLREALGLEARTHAEQALGINIVVLAVGSRHYSLIVDGIDNTEEIVIKPLRGLLKGLVTYSGATVLGDGGVALILDVAGIATSAGIDLTDDRDLIGREVTPPSPQTQQMLIFDIGDDTRCAVPLSMISRLEQVNRSSIERVGGQEVMQYRQELLPIIRPESVFAPNSAPEVNPEQLLLVFDFGKRVALAARQIIDVCDVKREIDAPADAGTMLLGKTVILGRTTLMLDVMALMRRTSPQSLGAAQVKVHRGKIIMADASPGMRSAVESFLYPAGINVTPVDSKEALLKELSGTAGPSYTAVVLDNALVQGQQNHILAEVKQRWPNLPLVVWNCGVDRQAIADLQSAGAHTCLSETNRDALLEVLRESMTQASGAAERSV